MINSVKSQSAVDYYKSNDLEWKRKQENEEIAKDYRCKEHHAEEKSRCTENNELEECRKSSYEQLKSQGEKLKYIIDEQNAKLEERIKNGEDEPVIHIGASSMTKREWDVLMSRVDRSIEKMRELAELEDERKLKKKDEDRLIEKDRKVKQLEQDKLEKKWFGY